jgi:hypothetical protein
MMKCAKCGVSVMEKRLERTVPLGEVNKIWMCIDCIGIEHPELAKNITEDRTDIDDTLDEICYGKK